MLITEELCLERAKEYTELASNQKAEREQDFYAGKAAAYEDMAEDLKKAGCH